MTKLHHYLVKRKRRYGEHHVTSSPDVVLIIVTTIVSGRLVQKGEEEQRLLGSKQDILRYHKHCNSSILNHLKYHFSSKEMNYCWFLMVP